MNSQTGTDRWIAPERCRQLLAATRVARLAFVDDGQPRLVVLNHAVDGEDVVFQTSEDTTVARLVGNEGSIPAVVETDSAWSTEQAGWSIVASGRLSRTSAEELGRMPHPWRPEAVGVLLRLSVEEIHGLAVEQP
jgi:nitroimidazol reductase NimA-like FMN-containing flavoprotein (pyridoxamine 5'-phosphate oxidase superfamily)